LPKVKGEIEGVTRTQENNTNCVRYNALSGTWLKMPRKINTLNEDSQQHLIDNESLLGYSAM
jgi:hypothetical protein